MNVSNFYAFKKKILSAQRTLSTNIASNDENCREHANDTFDVIEMEEEHIEEDNLLYTDENIDEHQTNVTQLQANSTNESSQDSGKAKIGQIPRKRQNDSSTNRTPTKKSKTNSCQTERVTIQTNECLICPAVLDDILQLNDHVASHTNIFCKACNRSFARYSNLKRHFNVIHSKPKPFVCDLCGLNFTFSVNLQAHASLHYSGKIRMK